MLEVAKLIVKDNEIYLVFQNEDAAEQWAPLFPNYIKMTSFGGFMNAIHLGDVK